MESKRAPEQAFQPVREGVKHGAAWKIDFERRGKVIQFWGRGD